MKRSTVADKALKFKTKTKMALKATNCLKKIVAYNGWCGLLFFSLEEMLRAA